ncbi:hypothetical protein JW998_07570 [candidate division KSB1 bacterium]|nr:hypothetical protein [candidate division KSB1 bacterium]
MLKAAFKKIKEADSYKKRGVLYASVAILFMLYEFIFHRPPRLTVLLLWLGLLIIAVFVMTTLKDPRR